MKSLGPSSINFLASFSSSGIPWGRSNPIFGDTPLQGLAIDETPRADRLRRRLGLCPWRPGRSPRLQRPLVLELAVEKPRLGPGGGAVRAASRDAPPGAR